MYSNYIKVQFVVLLITTTNVICIRFKHEEFGCVLSRHKSVLLVSCVRFDLMLACNLTLLTFKVAVPAMSWQIPFTSFPTSCIGRSEHCLREGAIDISCKTTRMVANENMMKSLDSWLAFEISLQCPYVVRGSLHTHLSCEMSF